MIYFCSTGLPIDETMLSDTATGLCGQKEAALGAVDTAVTNIFGVHLDEDNLKTNHEGVTSKMATGTAEHSYVCQVEGIELFSMAFFSNDYVYC